MTITTTKHFLSTAMIFAKWWLFFSLLSILPATPQSIAVNEFQLKNGIQVLLSPRPHTQATHIAWFIRDSQSSIDQVPPEAKDLLLLAWASPFKTQGASEFWMEATAQGISYGVDIPSKELNSWLNNELNRLKQTIEQWQIDSAINYLKEKWKKSDPISDQIAIALNVGQPSATVGHVEKNLTSIDINGLAQKMLIPEKITIILIGDIDQATAIEALNTNFGQLPPSSLYDSKANNLQSLDEPNEGRDNKQQIFISSDTQSEICISWQIPTHNSETRQTLDLFAELLAGSPDSKLCELLISTLGCSNKVQIFIEEPDGQPLIVFSIRADVADGHLLTEVEPVILKAVKNTIQNGFRIPEINRIARRMDAKRALSLSSPPKLAQALAQALFNAVRKENNLNQALRPISQSTHLEPETIVPILEAIFLKTPHFSVLAERNPILFPQSQQHAHLVSLLSQLHTKKGTIQTQSEEKIKTTLRQFSLMPKEMRQQFILLLQSEVTR